MNIKQTILALGLLAAGIAVFGFFASRSAPLAPEPAPGPNVPASEFVEQSQYLSIRVSYPEAPAAERAVIEQEMQALVAQFKTNTRVDDLTPADIELIGLGEGRRYTLDAEYGSYVSAPQEPDGEPEYRSYAYTVYEDTLGAHPNAHFKTFTFDAEGNLVRLADLFSQNPSWLEELSALVSADVVAQYRERAQLDDVTDLVYAEGLAPQEENFQNFVIDGDDLLVLIPPYQVAAYAAGAFEARVPLADLQ